METTEKTDDRVQQLQQALDESVERFRTFLTLTRQAYGCIEFDVPISTQLPPAHQASCMLAAKLVDCNDEFAKIYGASLADDLIGARFVSLIFSIEEKFIPRARRFVTSGYRLVNEEVENVLPDGNHKILIANIVGELSGRSSDLTRMWITFEDVTLRRLVEKVADADENQIREFEGRLDCGFWMMDWKKFSVIYVGRAFEDLWKLSRTEILEDPMAWVDRIHPDDRARVNGAFLSQVDKGTYDETFRLMMPDGSIRLIRDRGFPMPNRQGEIERIVGLATDVTKQREAQAGLNHFFDLSKEMLAVIDTDGNFRQVNPAFCQATGYTKSELVGKRVLDYIHESDRDSSVEMVSQLNSGIPAVDVDNRFLFHDGNYREMEWNIAPLSLTGVLYAIVHDVSDRDQNLLPNATVALVDTLTPREREIMRLVVDGQPNKSIARLLGISQRTVEKHRSRVMKKLEIDNVPDLVKLAMQVDSKA